jgi:succinate dehydrogenase/fumarate reductase flavoprotein subunit
MTNISPLRSSTPVTAKMSIHLIIIGAGLAGLSAAISTKVANPEHKVTILESVKELAEIGVCASSHFRSSLSLTPL